MLSKKLTDKWRKDYDRQLTIAENKLIPKITRYYQSQYNEGVKNFINSGATGYTSLFKYDFFENIYIELYSEISMRFAKWYQKNNEKYIKKEDPKKFTETWRTSFNYYAGRVAATNVTLVTGTARLTLIRITQRLYRDPNFVTLGAEERARILRNKFKQYSRFQAIRLVRTESCRAASYGIEQSALKVYAGRAMKKQWITFLDNNTRDEHARANGQEVDFDKPFVVGGENLMRPGSVEEGASGWNVINCRCSMVPFPADVDINNI